MISFFYSNFGAWRLLLSLSPKGRFNWALCAEDFNLGRIYRLRRRHAVLSVGLIH